MTICSNSSDPLVVIVGATGKQGGSFLRNLVESDKSYRFRALTRDASKSKPKSIAKSGVEVVEVDLKPENHKEMVKAFQGADVVFAMTNFWEHVDDTRELKEGKAMVDAALEARVKLFIYSGLPSPAKVSNGKHHKVLHYESKAAVDDYGRSHASANFIYRTVQAAHFHDLFQVTGGLNFFHKDGSGGFYAALPVALESLEKGLLPLVDGQDEYGLWSPIHIHGAMSTYEGPFADPEMLSASDINHRLSRVASTCDDAIRNANTEMGKYHIYSSYIRPEVGKNLWTKLRRGFEAVKDMSNSDPEAYDLSCYKVDQSLSTARNAYEYFPGPDVLVINAYAKLRDVARTTKELTFGLTCASRENSVLSTTLSSGPGWYDLPPKVSASSTSQA